MNKLIKIALGAALPAVWAAGCSDFLKGGNLTISPNNPVQGSASNSQLFVSIQTQGYVFQESDLGRSVAQWMQELIGVQRQQVQVYNYSGISNATFDGQFQQPYIGGGLIDLHTLEASTAASGDLVYLGIAQVLEGWQLGQTADLWGDIPYSQAANYTAFPTPILDTQQSVYDSVETLLSAAITNIAGAGGGPGGVDLVYFSGTSAAAFAAQKACWTQLAHTLKARFYLHQAKQLGAAAYTSALAEANLGISSNSCDYKAYHQAGLQLSSNLWWQFMDVNGGTGRAGDLVAASGATHSTMWDMMTLSGDPRFAEYFSVANVNGGEMSPTRLSSGFRQPLVTYNENLLIISESQFALGNVAAAKTALNTEQTAWATATPWHSSIVVPLTAVATLPAIMTEKYITLFQNLEVWQDWQRTCIPALTPVVTTSAFGGGKIPARLWYGSTEQQTNPNIPAVGTPPNGDTNWNLPTRCP